MTKKIKFLQKKGMCQPGHIGEYPKDQADRLIEKGVAEEYKAPKKVYKPKKETTNGGDE